jgi:hypothetical protein
VDPIIDIDLLRKMGIVYVNWELSIESTNGYDMKSSDMTLSAFE